MNNEEEQKELEREIIELEKQLEYKKEKYKRLKFIDENGRYYINATGYISELIPTVNNEIWEKAIKQNNTFKTKKDAEKERDRRELLYEFNQFKNERNNGWTPNWKDFNTSKNFVAVDSDGYLKCMSMYCTKVFVKFGYFRNYEDCIEAIKKFGDRIKQLYID
mgnify:CR=1 FL=1|jgi:hypothetical protein